MPVFIVWLHTDFCLQILEFPPMLRPKHFTRIHLSLFQMEGIVCIYKWTLPFKRKISFCLLKDKGSCIKGDSPGSGPRTPEYRLRGVGNDSFELVRLQSKHPCSWTSNIRLSLKSSLLENTIQNWLSNSNLPSILQKGLLQVLLFF